MFKLWGETINIREQQDAFDFFQAIIDQIDEQIKVSNTTDLPFFLFILMRGSRKFCQWTSIQMAVLPKVRSALCAASQLPGEGPTDVDDAHAPAC